MEEKKETRSFIVPRDPSIDRRFRPRPNKKLNLFNLIKEDIDEVLYEENSCSFESMISEKESSSETSSNRNLNTENALVYLRMRPVSNAVLSRYVISDQKLITNHIETNTASVQNSIERHFTFSHIFDDKVSQGLVYENCILDKIEAENNFTVMTYGTSGSGKTFTLLGTPEEPGIIPRSLENIFSKYAQNLYSLPSVLIKNGDIIISNDEYLQECKLLRKTFLDSNADLKKDYEKSRFKIMKENAFKEKPRENESILIYCSFIEIYNEIVHDLLNPKNNLSASHTGNKKSGLKVMMNEGKVFVKDITSIFVKNSFEAYQLLWNGLKRITFASTAINANSSRSHCIFMIDIIKYNEPDIFTHISYKFCDLAGSERLGKTGNKGTRLREAQQINKSLMVLGRCLDAAYNNQNKKHPDIIPYRESKLTMLLQASLQGKEKITMIVNITPTEEYFEENINVLSFSSIARNIVYKPVEEKRKHTRFSWMAHTVSNEQFEELWDENCTLRSEIERLSNVVEKLENKLVQQEIDLRKELVNHFETQGQKRKVKWEEKVQNTEIALKKFYEAKIEAMKNNYERKIDRLREENEMFEEELNSYKTKLENIENINCNSHNPVKKLRTTLDAPGNYEK